MYLFFARNSKLCFSRSCARSILNPYVLRYRNNNLVSENISSTPDVWKFYFLSTDIFRQIRFGFQPFPKLFNFFVHLILRQNHVFSRHRKLTIFTRKNHKQNFFTSNHKSDWLCWVSCFVLAKTNLTQLLLLLFVRVRNKKNSMLWYLIFFLRFLCFCFSAVQCQYHNHMIKKKNLFIPIVVKGNGWKI